MRVDLDKYLDKNVFRTIKTAIGYSLKTAWNKISYVIFVNWHKLQKNDNLGRLCLPLT